MVKDILYLVDILKNELFITWDDESTNKRLQRIVSNAIQTMNYKIGSDIDYKSEPTKEKEFRFSCWT